MATGPQQHARAWFFWLACISLRLCSSLAGGEVWVPQTEDGFARQNAPIHAKNLSEPSIERVMHYGHLTIGTKKMSPTVERSPSDKESEMFAENPQRDANYQSDSHYQAVQESEHLTEGVIRPRNKKTRAVDRLLGMKPKVECVDDSMTLKLNGATSLGFNFLVDRGHAHPLPLLKMPSDCGYTVRKTWRDLSFSAPYDGCFVAQEDSCYVLPLVIYGLPVRMSCPSTAPAPPSVSCHANGMTVEIQSSGSAKAIQVKVNSKWESLMRISARCGFSVVEHSRGVTISAPYQPCIKEQDGLLTFEVAAEADYKISCPIQTSSPAAMVTACPECTNTCPECASIKLPGPPATEQALPHTNPATPGPAHGQHPQRPAPLSTEAPLSAVDPKWPDPMQFPAQFPGPFWPPLIPNSVPEKPQPPPKAVVPTTQAPSVAPKTPAPVEDSSDSKKPDPMQFPAQFPFFWFPPTPNSVPKISEKPQPPPKAVVATTQAPSVAPKTPAPDEDSSDSKQPDPMQFPAQFPFYSIPPEYFWPGPNTIPDISEETQPPQNTVAPSTQAPLNAVAPEDSAGSLPPLTPGPMHFKPQYSFYPPFFPLHSGPQQPQPAVVQATPAPLDDMAPTPAHAQHPQRPAPLSTEAPLSAVDPKWPDPMQFPAQFPGPFWPPLIPNSVPEKPQPPPKAVPTTQAPSVAPKTPAPVEDSADSKKPDPMQFPAQFPFYSMPPEYFWPRPNTIPDISEKLQPPQNTVAPSTQAPLNTVAPKTPAPVEDSADSKKPDPMQFPAQFPVFWLPHNPNAEKPQPPQKAVVPTTPAPLNTVSPSAPVEDSSDSKQPDPMQFPAQFPFYSMPPEYFWPRPNTIPDISEKPLPPQNTVAPSTQAPLNTVAPKTPAPVEDSADSKKPDPMQFPAQFPFYSMLPGHFWPTPNTIPEQPQPPQNIVVPSTQAPLTAVAPEKQPAHVEDSAASLPPLTPEPMHFKPQYFYPFYPPHPGYMNHPGTQQPQPAVVPTTQAPLDDDMAPTPAHAQHPQRSAPLSTEAPLSAVQRKWPDPMQFPSAKADGQSESGDQSQSSKSLHANDLPANCSTVCVISSAYCCPMSVSFHQHLHHHNHNHFSPTLHHQTDQQATGGNGQDSIKQLFRSAGVNKRPTLSINSTEKQTSSIPSLKSFFFPDQNEKPAVTDTPAPTAKPSLPPNDQIRPPFWNPHMSIPVPVPANIHTEQLTRMLPPVLPNPQTAAEPYPNNPIKLLQNAKHLTPDFASSANPSDPANRFHRIESPRKSPSMSSLQTNAISKPQSPVPSPDPYPWLPYFFPYQPPISKSSSSSEQPSLPRQSDSVVVQPPHFPNNVLPPINVRPPKNLSHSLPPYPFFIPTALRSNIPEGMQSMPGESSHSHQVHSTASKHSTSKPEVAPSGLGPQRQYWHQMAGNGYSKVPSKPQSTKPQVNIIGPSNQILPHLHPRSGYHGKSILPMGSPQSLKDYWKPPRTYRY